MKRTKQKKWLWSIRFFWFDWCCRHCVEELTVHARVTSGQVCLDHEMAEWFYRVHDLHDNAATTGGSYVNVSMRMRRWNRWCRVDLPLTTAEFWIWVLAILMNGLLGKRKIGLKIVWKLSDWADDEKKMLIWGNWWRYLYPFLKEVESCESTDGILGCTRGQKQWWTGVWLVKSLVLFSELGFRA